MKSSITGPRNTANLSEAIHRQLNMYAIVAGAAGVGVLALAQPSEAKIVYTPANIQVSGNQHYDLDLNNDGAADFTITLFSHHSYCRGLCVARNLTEEPARSNGAIGKPPAALIAGSVIGQSNLFYDGAGAMAFLRAHCRDGCSFHNGGNWLGVADRYLGLAFELHGKTYYGWARLSVAAGLTHATVTGYAYETIPNKAIIAGKTRGAEDEWEEDNPGPSTSLTSPIPNTRQSATLGMLALGAQGVPLRRRKQSIGAAS